MEAQAQKPEVGLSAGMVGELRTAKTVPLKLSYKFQRLREKLRTAIISGEFQGKLPGERQLARRFHANAKTLSKALTDLAAEGLLERSIGRGTFVRTTDQPAATLSTSSPGAERWLMVCDADQTSSAVVECVRKANPLAQLVCDTASLRPSFLNAIKAVIDFSSRTADHFIRDLVVRNIMVVLVGRQPTTYSVNAVLVDRALGASCLARDMMLLGHRRFLAVERRGQAAVADTIRNAALRYAPEATVETAFPGDAVAAVEQQGITAVICDSRRAAVQVRQSLAARGWEVPGRISLAAIGSGWGEYPCSGYYVHAQQKADTIVQLLRDTQIKRPTTLWLTGTYQDLGTIAPPPTGIDAVVGAGLQALGA